MFSKATVTLFLLALFVSAANAATVVASCDSRQSSDGKQKELTSEEQQKLRKAEEVADKFVQRWHETLDLNVLFDEFYSSDEVIRQQNAHLFCAVYMFITGGTNCRDLLGRVSTEMMRDSFFAFWNLAYAQDEYRLAFGEDADTPKEIEEAGKLMERIKEKYWDEKGNRRMRLQTKQLVAEAAGFWKKVAALYREHLTPDVFASERYKTNYQAQQGDEESAIMSDSMDAMWKLEKGRPVYNVHRGVFDIYLIEENGEFKVLTLGFEL